MPLTPDPAAVARFRADLEALTGEPPSPARGLGLAVSGGPDSMAMLLLAAAAWPGAVVAATVDHGLRPESASEAAMVGEVCAALGVPHDTLAVPSAVLACDSGSLPERAREARYDLLHRWAWPIESGQDYKSSIEDVAGGPRHTRWIATAHQQDDVAESFLMRAFRGSGVGGLAEMPRCRHGWGGEPERYFIRPLLEWPRETLAEIVLAAGIAAAADPSNADPRFDRSRVRQLLAANPEIPAERLARSARNLRHAEDALEWIVAREHDARIDADGKGGIAVDPGELPYELRRRFLRIGIQRAREDAGLFDSWRETGLDRLLAALDSGGTGTIAEVRARAAGGKWHFTLAPPRRSH